jgi:hypothetical protein
MLRRVALVGTVVSDECSAAIIRVLRISKLGILRSLRRLLVTTNGVPSSPILITLMVEALSSSVTLFLKRVTQRCIQEDGILYSHRHENLKSYIVEFFY